MQIIMFCTIIDYTLRVDQYRNNSISTRTKLTFQLTPAAINGIVSCRSTVAPRYTVFDAFHIV